MKKRTLFLFVSVLWVSCSVAQAQSLDRGHALLLKKGFQLQAITDQAVNAVQVSLFEEANFTTFHFGAGSWESRSSGPETHQWAQWSFLPSDPHPNTEKLATASFVDELQITNPTVVSDYAAWLADMRTAFPNVISHTTQGINENDLPDIQNYMAIAKPDMLYFDLYPFTNSTWAGGSPTDLYSIMSRYRVAGMAGHDGSGDRPVPVGMWYQSYRLGGYVMSESEQNVQYYAAMAYGYKSLSSFTFTLDNNAGEPLGSIFFDGPPSATNRTSSYFVVQELNSETLNLSPALLRLVSTDLRFVSGRDAGGTSIPLPDDTLTWDSAADPYITNIVATNLNLGSKNNGNEGDVLVGYLKPLDASFTNLGYEDDTYFMLVNGLTDPTGSAVDTAQSIRLDFDFGTSGITGLQRLSRTTGLVETINLISDGGSLYHTNRILLGGEGDLFKFDNGGTFVSEASGAVLSWGSVESSEWDSPSSWTFGDIPSVNDKVVFGSAISAPRSVSVDSPITIKNIQFNNMNSYAIAGLGSVDLESNLGSAVIDVLQGSHQFQTIVNLNSPTNVNVDSGATLTFNNALNLNGNDLTKTGSGMMKINNVLNTSGGVVSAAAGVVSGSGLISGDFENSGATLAPGNSPGTLTIAGNYAHGADATLLIELSGLLQGIEYDLLDVTGLLALNGGALDVVLLDGFNPSADDVFDILDFAAMSGLGFDSLNLPPLAEGLVWDTSEVMTSGSLSVRAVPEPSSVLLSSLGLISIAMYGWRKDGA